MADNIKLSNTSKYYRDAKDRYLREKVDTFVLRVPKGQKDVIKEYAAKYGMSLNSYILSLIGKDIEGLVTETEKTNTSQKIAKPVQNKLSDTPNSNNQVIKKNQSKKLPSWLM